MKPFKRNIQYLELLNSEVNSLLESEWKVTQGFSTRGALLIASSGLIGGNHVVEKYNLLGIISVFLLVVSIFLGILVILPRKGAHIDVKKLEEAHWGKDYPHQLRNIYHQKLTILENNKEANITKSRKLTAGFIFFGLALVTLFLSYISFELRIL